MDGLQALPAEVLNLTIEHLVTSIGIQKAILLRAVNRAFDAAILHAICVSQVIDIDDPATPYLVPAMNPRLRGKIILVKSRHANSKSYIQTVTNVNRTLDSLIYEPSQERIDSRHTCIAEAIIPEDCCSLDVSTESQNLLSAAAVLGDLSLVKLLLDRNSLSSTSVDISSMTPFFDSPLTLAAARGHLEVVRYLLEAGARADSFSRYLRNSKRLTTLADWNGNDEYLRSGCLLDTPQSALRAAVSGGYTDIVHLLLHPKHRLPITSLEYLRAIIAGVKVGRLDLIEALFKQIGKTMSDFIGFSQDMLWAAVRSGQREVVQMLLDNGADVNACPDSNLEVCPGPLGTAASLGNIEMARFLLERGAIVNPDNPSLQGRLPIQRAALRGYEEVVELLLEHGADPADAFPKAAHGGQCRVLNYLLRRFPDLPGRQSGEVGQNALCKALLSANLTAITILIEAGVEDKGQPWLFEGAMDIAKKCNPWLVQHLISLGVQETDTEVSPIDLGSSVRGVVISDRTWEWVSRY